MKKLCLGLICIILLMVNLSFAQTSAREETNSDRKSTFTNLSLTGIDRDGVPAYIEMTTSGNKRVWLYVDDDLKLRLVSGATLGVTQGVLTSPPTTDWQNQGMVVGTQKGAENNR